MPAENEVIVRVGGAAGEGGASTGESIARLFSRHGLHIITYTSYQSAIRGGHNWIQVRGSPDKVHSQGDGLDLLLVLSSETVDIHSSAISPGGVILYNSEKIKNVENLVRQDVKKLGIPATQMARKYGNLPIQNTILIGALTQLLGMKLDTLVSVIETIFGKKKSDVVKFNSEAAQEGYNYSQQNFQPLGKKMNYTFTPKLLMTGNNALSLGAVTAGCKFYAAYPMTPASTILHWMAAHSTKYSVLVKQAEDELAVVNMAIGAAHAGARAMCGTSGGGFALMSEAIGQAGMTETPVVIVESQRCGPSTGLPTKTEQGDLLQMVGAGQSDYPKIILAPRTVEECFYTANEAFNLADKYQCPVIIASDLYLSEHFETLDSLNLDSIPIDRGLLVDDNEDGGDYKRYKFTESGISPRAIPGQPGHMFVAGTDEHDEKGVLISDVLCGIPKYVEIRARMMEKRMKKMEMAMQDMKAPSLEGAKDAELTLVGWGSTLGPIKDAMLALEQEGISVNSAQFKYLWPFPAEESEQVLGQCKKLLLVECNYSGQFGLLLASQTGIRIKEKLLKYDGEPIYPSEIVTKVKQVIGHI